MAVNSSFSAIRCGSDTVPVADSVAMVTARFRRVVTAASEPSATCSSPTPSFALRADCVKAVMLAWRPSAIARPAASSAPVLMREPDDNWKRAFCRLLLVIVNWFCAASDAVLFRTLSDILDFSLVVWLRHAGTLFVFTGHIGRWPCRFSYQWPSPGGRLP